MDFISIIFFIVIVTLMTKGIIGDLKQNKTFKPKNSKKRHDSKNNYFRNSPQHVDMTNDYIESIWDETNKSPAPKGQGIHSSGKT